MIGYPIGSMVKLVWQELAHHKKSIIHSVIEFNLTRPSHCKQQCHPILCHVWMTCDKSSGGPIVLHFYQHSTYAVTWVFVKWVNDIHNRADCLCFVWVAISSVSMQRFLERTYFKHLKMSLHSGFICSFSRISSIRMNEIAPWYTPFEQSSLLSHVKHTFKY